MPYIKKDTRELLDIGYHPRLPGELNYVITKIVLRYLGDSPSYRTYNDAVGALECAKMELYRRRISTYEYTKIAEHGDVY